ncbi:tetratricopeptide repeat protein [Coprococcus hominis (ex Arizal et al. 2022)]|uniref:tetratricopeptide repeat protein n=1 Tax=Coprococcus hominis (ex Arizal et al. 2022) TaxID=2881262 RepID=UPI0032BF74CF
MASVNKIKELANSREYSLALELVEHQDLTKSLNPQFLRLCGEIYIKNDRYKDARRCLIMAHRLGPESKRVLYTFVELYLRMGYFQLAKTYYDMYMFDANAYDSRDMEYVWNKHEHADDYKTLEPLIAGYAHNLDYDWSFELYLLYKKEEKQNEAATLAELYHASFKNSDNSQIILDIEAGKVKVDTYFDIYADTEAVDDDPDMEALRAEEQELLAADDLRMHPKEAEITIMYEDSYTPAGSEKKVQKMLKKQEREEQRKEKKLLKKQKQQEKAEAAAAAEAEKTEAEVKPATEEKTETETKVPETVADETEQKTSEKTTVTEQETAEKASVTETSEQKTAEEASETEAEEPEKEKKKGFFQRRKRKKHEEESETTDADIEETKEVTSESEDVKPSEEPKESNSDISSEIAETTGQAEDMRHGKGTIAKDVVVVDEDDGFEAEADTIEELASKEHVTQETETKEAEVTTAKKTTFEFQTVELAPEDFEEEYEVDDFSETVDDEFGEMKMPEPKPEIEETVEEEPEVEEEIEEPEVVEPEPEIEAEPEPEIEETVEEAVKEEPEAELEIEETVEEEPEAEEEIEEPEVVEPEPEVEAEPELEIEETVEDVVEEEPETELEIEETVEEEPEVEVEIEEPEVVELEPEVESESEPEIEETVVEEAVEEEPETEEEIEELEEEPKEEFHVAPFTTKPEKKKLDFPVFKSSLFPDYHKEVKVVENNFNEIMEEAQDKMTENMQKEEQMQREAEALLASLGISMDAIPTTPKAEVKEEQPVQKGPSRDELKASLKIDSVKKNLLKRVKEYR